MSNYIEVLSELFPTVLVHAIECCLLASREERKIYPSRALGFPFNRNAFEYNYIHATISFASSCFPAQLPRAVKSRFFSINMK